MPDLEGLVFNNRQFGYCKVVDHQGRQVKIRFCGTDREAWYTLDALLNGKDFKWTPLPTGLRCLVEGRGECLIVRAPFEPSQEIQVHEYAVEFDSQGRESANLTERDLWPIPGSLTETPLTRLVGLQVDPWMHFKAREDLIGALTYLHRETAGIHALAASRIQLLAHQAFVIGSVIDDASWRYILADEVGLGKTVEAGAIAHELLSTQPAARVLVLTPGALSRQWLCEMHLSFGGRDFKLADLHDAHHCDWKGWSRVICSLKLATHVHSTSLHAQHWDLIIVDEAHHLLWNRTQYDFVKTLSAEAGGILLLSAVPAREREQELLRLLQLIEPTAYADGTVKAARFAELYREQSTIGRRLRILSNRLDNETIAAPEILQAAQRLIDTPIMRSDALLLDRLEQARRAEQVVDLANACRALRDDVASRYRISRRILKNRRSQLLDQALLVGVERRLETRWYKPKRLEATVEETLLEVMNGAADAGAPRDALHVFFRKAAPALCDPVALMEVASSLCFNADEDAQALGVLDPSAVLDYDDHSTLLEQACAALAPFIDRQVAERLRSLAVAWVEAESVPSRVDKLIEALDELQERGCAKILVFAGTLGAAELVVEQLQQRYGEQAVGEFRHDLGDDRKESEVTRFRRDAACRLLVSDESGGEGRNFQFASALVHFDMPWSVAAVEQRIGRLDRIGRTDPVLSVVIAAQASIESEWIRCLEQGFEVFTRSISGLEFMLRETEHDVIESVIRGGAAALESMIAEVQAASQQERASDDAEALTDFASMNKGRRYFHTADHKADALLDASFPRYFRTIAISDAAKRVTDQRDFNLKIWRFRPEDITQLQLPGVYRDPNGQLQDHYGIFLRNVARDRPDLEFFSTGNGLFDAVCAVAKTNIKDRTFAVQIASDDAPAGLFLLVTWCVIPGASPEQAAGLGRAVRHLYGRRIQVLMNADTSVVVDRVTTQGLIANVFSEDSSATDLHAKILTRMEPRLDTWPTQLASLAELSRAQAKNDNKELFVGIDAVFYDGLAFEMAQWRQVSDSDEQNLIHALEASRVAVQNPLFELDSIGIVHVVNFTHDTPASS
ncbi:SNF2-related protein [Paraburkholderia sp. A1BS-2L]|uniref:SNF2-related protein n=1 Tax=Paraburkholderia sp. A1BS-2L TaxID=3028373 RepID=UPI003DA9DE8A